MFGIANVVESAVFLRACHNCVGFRGVLERPKEAKLRFGICYGRWVNGNTADAVYLPFREGDSLAARSASSSLVALSSHGAILSQTSLKEIQWPLATRSLYIDKSVRKSYNPNNPNIS